MKSPITGKEMVKMVRKETLVYRGEDFLIDYHYFLCQDSGEEFTTGAIDDLNVMQVYELYSDRHGIIMRVTADGPVFG